MPPLALELQSALISRMHARQQSWASAAARSRSSGSDGSDGSQSPAPGIPSLSQAQGQGKGQGSSSSIALGMAGPSSIGFPGNHPQLIRPAPISTSGIGNMVSTGTKQLGQGQGQGQGQVVPKVKKKREGDGKRRKVAKACLVCQKSHLTCDEQRPCTRCVKKGIADMCVEGVRKKAKYLMEGEGDPLDFPLPTLSISPSASIPAPPASSVPPTHAQSRLIPEPEPSFSLPLPTPPSASSSSTLIPQVMPQIPHQSMPAPMLPIMGGIPGLEDDIWLAPNMLEASRGDSPTLEGDRIWGDHNLFGNGFDFGTSASNEYQMLDAMLNSMSPVFPFDLSGDPLPLDPIPQPHSYLQPQPSTYPLNPSFSHPMHPPTAPNLISPNWPINPSPQPPSNSSTSHQAQATSSAGNPSPWTNWTDSTPANSASVGSENTRPAVIKRESTDGPGVSTGKGRYKTGAEVYHTVVKPFDYTEGYHRLMEHMSKNFQKKEILRVVKALAAFRPSLIALQMPMSEEDEVFLERSFQRTLIELEKLISYSATPTAVWRRTGDLVYANPEFCGMIGKQQDEMLSGKTYVYELFAKHTAISYWENFSVHAFENTTQNFFQSATLEVGGKQTACSCCFTIRRDVFDLPSVVIGQFLPIPMDM